VTPDEYRACIRALGLTPCRPSFQGSTLHQNRDGLFQQIEDPENYSPEERASLIDLIKMRMGISDH